MIFCAKFPEWADMMNIGILPYFMLPPTADLALMIISFKGFSTLPPP